MCIHPVHVFQGVKNRFRSRRAVESRLPDVGHIGYASGSLQRHVTAEFCDEFTLVSLVPQACGFRSKEHLSQSLSQKSKRG
jgi:hypothetical protein